MTDGPKEMQKRQRLGRYELRGVLGHGVSTVYDAWDPAIERRVAIKVLRLQGAEDDEVREKLVRFRREAQVAGGLVHPNIVGVLDYHEGDNEAYTVMELVDGRPLDHVLGEERRFPLPRALGIMQDVLSALAFVHARGITHRDIKPANLMLTRDGHAKLADFGVAHTKDSQQTEHGMLVGTIAYMSAEQHDGGEVGTPSDIFAMGVLLQEMLTGRCPFNGAPARGDRRPLATDAPDLAPETCRRLEQAITKATAVCPTDRPTAWAFAEALQKLTDQQPVKRTNEILRRLREIRLVLLFAAAALAGLAFCIAVFPRPSGHPLQAIAQAAAAVPCALVTVEDQGEAEPIRVGGMVGPGAEAALRAAVGKQPVAWRLTTIDGPYCAAVEIARKLATPASVGTTPLTVSLDGDRTVFQDGELMLAHIGMPDFPAHLRVDYLMHDGTVLHLLPSEDYPDRLLTVGSVQDIGKPQPSGPFYGWHFDQPAGRDRDMFLVTAAATSLPVTATPDPEQAAPYLAKLSAAIDEARARGDRVAATVLLIDTVAAPSH